MKNQPIRVLKVLGSTGLGGAENMVFNYYTGIDKSKVQFDFLLHHKHKSGRDDAIRKMGGQVFYVPSIKLINYFKYRKALKAFFKEHHYKIVHSHINAYSYWVLREAKKNNVPVRIAHSHTSLKTFKEKIFVKNKEWSATFKELVQWILRLFLIKQATHYFACGKKAGLWLFGTKNQDNFTIIKNAIDSSLFNFDEEEASLIKKELNIIDQKVIGHLGNFTEAKNHRFLIDVFYEMLKKNPSLVLVLIGDGPLRPQIETLVKKYDIEENVKFLGIRSDVHRILWAIDLLIFPSIYEGLPLSLVEAQASGLRILASSSITKEIAITPQISFLDLQKGTKLWAKTALKNMQYKRESNLERIVDSGYDIASSAKKLQEFYTKTASSCAE